MTATRVKDTEEGPRRSEEEVMRMARVKRRAEMEVEVQVSVTTDGKRN